MCGKSFFAQSDADARRKTTQKKRFGVTNNDIAKAKDLSPDIPALQGRSSERTQLFEKQQPAGKRAHRLLAV